MDTEPAIPDRTAKRRRRRRAAPHDPYYIQASSPLSDEQRRVLKQGDTFAVFDHYGDVKPGGLGEEGLYHEGTRYLSWYLLRLGRERPLFLSSTVKEDNEVLTVDLANPDVVEEGRVAVGRGTLHVFRTKCLWRASCYERLTVQNFGLAPVAVSLSLHFQADFADIFEVRGTRRARRGQHLGTTIEDGAAVIAYEGLDGVTRRTRLRFAPTPSELGDSGARFELELPPHGSVTIDVTVSCERGRVAPEVVSFDHALADAERRLGAERSRSCTARSANGQFNAWVDRSAADLVMMTTETPEGPYPYAGVPWFSTPFGRDGLITAFECLWLDPALARGVLGYLAATQAKAVVPLQDAEPGKILHETRDGEMAALAEIPFGRYYGSVDATPLFVWLAGAYLERTGDRAFVESIWPNVELALRWIDEYGDRDGDGFVEYQRRSPNGLEQQGWKDSHDAIFHADGSLAEPPIALCEVQGYVFAAKRTAADVAQALGRAEAAAELRHQAERLRCRFEEAFWCEDLGTYALALDGTRRPCKVRTSNPGHCLWAGIARPDRARRTAQTLLAPDSFSGWGVRTVSALERRYNPMSYHDGSVWPHDNALATLGLAAYGLKDMALRVVHGMFDASLSMDLHRMPELFCGFDRRPGEGPTQYPVACAPQAWAAAAVFGLLQACLGISVQAEGPRISFADPVLPEFIPELEIHNLRVGAARVNLRLLRHGEDVGIHVLRRDGDVEIRMVT